MAQEIPWTHSKLAPEVIRSLTTQAENIKPEDEQGAPPLVLQIFAGKSVAESAKIMEDMAYLNGRDQEDNLTKTRISVVRERAPGPASAMLITSSGLQIHVCDPPPVSRLFGDNDVRYTLNDYVTGKSIKLNPKQESNPENDKSNWLASLMSARGFRGLF